MKDLHVAKDHYCGSHHIHILASEITRLFMRESLQSTTTEEAAEGAEVLHLLGMPSRTISRDESWFPSGSLILSPVLLGFHI